MNISPLSLAYNQQFPAENAIDIDDESDFFSEIDNSQNENDVRHDPLSKSFNSDSGFEFNFKANPPATDEDSSPKAPPFLQLPIHVQSDLYEKKLTELTTLKKNYDESCKNLRQDDDIHNFYKDTLKFLFDAVDELSNIQYLNVFQQSSDKIPHYTKLGNWGFKCLKQCDSVIIAIRKLFLDISYLYHLKSYKKDFIKLKSPSDLCSPTYPTSLSTTEFKELADQIDCLISQTDVLDSLKRTAEKLARLSTPFFLSYGCHLAFNQTEKYVKCGFTVYKDIENILANGLSLINQHRWLKKLVKDAASPKTPLDRLGEYSLAEKSIGQELRKKLIERRSLIITTPSNQIAQKIFNDSIQDLARLNLRLTETQMIDLLNQCTREDELKHDIDHLQDMLDNKLITPADIESKNIEVTLLREELSVFSKETSLLKKIEKLAIYFHRQKTRIEEYKEQFFIDHSLDICFVEKTEESDPLEVNFDGEKKTLSYEDNFKSYLQNLKISYEEFILIFEQRCFVKMVNSSSAGPLFVNIDNNNPEPSREFYENNDNILAMLSTEDVKSLIVEMYIQKQDTYQHYIQRTIQQLTISKLKTEQKALCYRIIECFAKSIISALSLLVTFSTGFGPVFRLAIKILTFSPDFPVLSVLNLIFSKRPITADSLLFLSLEHLFMRFVKPNEYGFDSYLIAVRSRLLILANGFVNLILSLAKYLVNLIEVPYNTVSNSLEDDAVNIRLNKTYAEKIEDKQLQLTTMINKRLEGYKNTLKQKKKADLKLAFIKTFNTNRLSTLEPQTISKANVGNAQHSIGTESNAERNKKFYYFNELDPLSALGDAIISTPKKLWLPEMNSLFKDRMGIHSDVQENKKIAEEVTKYFLKSESDFTQTVKVVC